MRDRRLHVSRGREGMPAGEMVGVGGPDGSCWYLIKIDSSFCFAWIENGVEFEGRQREMSDVSVQTI